jgi:hypothetical protein
MLTPADFNKKVDALVKSAKPVDLNGYFKDAGYNAKASYKDAYESKIRERKLAAETRKLQFPAVKLNIVVDKKNADFKCSVEGVEVCTGFMRLALQYFPNIETKAVNVFTLWAKLGMHYDYSYRDVAVKIARKLKLTRDQVAFVNKHYPNSISGYAGE